MSAGLAFAFAPGLLRAVGIGRGRLAAILAIEAEAIGQDRHQKEQHLKAGLECRRQILFIGDQGFDPLDCCFYIDIVHRHRGHPSFEMAHDSIGFQDGIFVARLSYAAIFLSKRPRH
ncbi:MAG: hypothetical protein AB7F20_16120 [Geoalkalibacter sp.]